jgi:hypothetical protein
MCRSKPNVPKPGIFRKAYEGTALPGRVASLAVKRGKSVDFTGYWQRHIVLTWPGCPHWAAAGFKPHFACLTLKTPGKSN